MHFRRLLPILSALVLAAPAFGQSSLGGAQNFQGGAPVATASLLPAVVKGKCAVGDLNCDGTVDANDLAVVLAAWGTNNPAADIDGNGTVDAADLSFILANWGASGAN